MEKNFYEISAGGTMLREGSYLDIQRSLVYRGERADFTPFLNVPLKELEKQLKASKVEEQKIYDQLKEAAEAWDEHGAQTLLLEKFIPELYDTEGHLVNQVADLPGAVLVPLPLIAGVCDLRRFQIFDCFLQEKGLRPMLIPGGDGLLHLLKDFLFLRLAFL